MWNEKHDTMTVYNRPLFQANQEMPNTINLKFQPGQILPFGIAPLHAAAALSFDQEMEHRKSIARDSSPCPTSGCPALTQRGSRTATRSTFSGLMGQNVDMRARIFRLELVALPSVMVASSPYDADDLNYYHVDEAVSSHPKRCGTITLSVLRQRR